MRRADGYSIQFCVKTERKIEHVPTGNKTGIDVGLLAYSTSSDGNTVENPRYMRLAEKKLKQLQRHLSRKKLAKAHLKVQRQREDFARKQANALVSSHDLIAFEDLQIRNLVRNRHLSKSIHDAGWGSSSPGSKPTA